jgi:hypothetical protein
MNYGAIAAVLSLETSIVLPSSKCRGITFWSLCLTNKDFSEKLISILNESSQPTELTFQTLGPKNTSLFFDYDQTLSVMDRQTYLEYLFTIQGVSLISGSISTFTKNA